MSEPQNRQTTRVELEVKAPGVTLTGQVTLIEGNLETLKQLQVTGAKLVVSRVEQLPDAFMVMLEPVAQTTAATRDAQEVLVNHNTPI